MPLSTFYIRMHPPSRRMFPIVLHLASFLRISKIAIFMMVFLGAVSSVCYGSSNLCLNSEITLKATLKSYEDRYKEAVDCVGQVKNNILCADFSDSVKKSREEHLKLVTLFEETKCVDFLILSLSEYDLFYHFAVRSLADYPAITTEYDNVSALAQQSLQNSGAAVVYKDAQSEKFLRVISEDLDSERARVSTIVRKYKGGLGLGIGLAIVGAGLLTGGASLLALDGTTAAPLGCPVDGRDFACVRQVNPEVAGALTGVGVAVLLGGVGEAIGVRFWLGRKQTPAQSLRSNDSKPDESKRGDARVVESTTPATAPAAPALAAAPAGSP